MPIFDITRQAQETNTKKVMRFLYLSSSKSNPKGVKEIAAETNLTPTQVSHSLALLVSYRRVCRIRDIGKATKIKPPLNRTLYYFTESQMRNAKRVFDLQKKAREQLKNGGYDGL